MQTGKLLKESEKEIGHSKPITSLSKSADGSHFITGSSDKTARVLHIEPFFSCHFHNPKSSYHSAVISEFLTFTCTGDIFQLWDIRTLTLLKTYVTERPVNACAISPLLDHVCDSFLLLYCS